MRLERGSMSGTRIDNHSFWAGKPGKDSRFPDGAKTKDESSAEGFGSLMHYEDTSSAIHSQQEMNKRKVHSHPRKDGMRN